MNHQLFKLGRDSGRSQDACSDQMKENANTSIPAVGSEILLLKNVRSKTLTHHGGPKQSIHLVLHRTKLRMRALQWLLKAITS